MDRKARKNIKEIQKELHRLKEMLKKIELRPCQGDADLRQKEEEIRMLKHEIYELERETNKYVLSVEGGGYTDSKA